MYLLIARGGSCALGLGSAFSNSTGIMGDTGNNSKSVALASSTSSYFNVSSAFGVTTPVSVSRLPFFLTAPYRATGDCVGSKVVDAVFSVSSHSTNVDITLAKNGLSATLTFGWPPSLLNAESLYEESIKKGLLTNNDPSVMALGDAIWDIRSE